MVLFLLREQQRFDFLNLKDAASPPDERTSAYRDCASERRLSGSSNGADINGTVKLYEAAIFPFDFSHKASIAVPVKTQPRLVAIDPHGSPSGLRVVGAARRRSILEKHK